MKKLLIAFFVCLTSLALAQDIANHAMPVGGGPGAVGWKTAGPCSAGLGLTWVTGAGADPTCASPGATSAIFASQFITCDNVTDNTAGFASLSTAIGTGGKKVILPQGRCLTTAWSLNGKSNIVVEGVAGTDISEIDFGTYIICTRSDSTTCFDWANSRGIHVRDTTFAYNSATYNGTLMSQGQTVSGWTANSMTNVQFKQTGSISHTALALLYVRNVVQWMGVAVKFEHAQAGLVGGFGGENIANTTNLTCIGCTFIALDAQAVLNPGEQWTFSGTWFFPKLDGTPIGIISTGTAIIRELNLYGIYMTDATLAGSWITAANGITGLNWVGGVCGNNAGTGNCITVTGAMSASQIAGVRFANLGTGINFGVGSTSTEVKNNDLASVTTPYVNQANCDNTCSFVSNSGTSVNLVNGSGSFLKASGTMAVAAGKTGTFSNTLTFTGTDASSVAFGTGGTATFTSNNLSVFSPTSSSQLAGVINDETGTGLLVFGTNPTFANGFVGQSTGNPFSFRAQTGGDVAAVRYNTVNAGESVGFGFQDNSVTKWILKKETSNNWRLTDFVNSIEVIDVTPGAVTAGFINFGYTTDATSTSTGAIRNPGGMSVNKRVFMNGLSADSASTDNSVCHDTTSHEIKTGTGAAGICLGTSSARYKQNIETFKDGLSTISLLNPKQFYYKPGFGDNGIRQQFGLLAEDLVKVEPRFVALDTNGRPNSVDWPNMIWVLINATKELKADNDNLRNRLTILEGTSHAKQNRKTSSNHGRGGPRSKVR